MVEDIEWGEKRYTWVSGQDENEEARIELWGRVSGEVDGIFVV